MRAKQIHTFTGPAKIGHTLERVDEEGKCSLKQLVRRRGVPLRDGSLNDPPPTRMTTTRARPFTSTSPYWPCRVVAVPCAFMLYLAS